MAIRQFGKCTGWRQISRKERECISLLLKRGKSKAQIARILRRAQSTISREIKKGTVLVTKNNEETFVYDPRFAHSVTQSRARKKGRKTNTEDDEGTMASLMRLIEE